jgi:hypothetical protein
VLRRELESGFEREDAFRAVSYGKQDDAHCAYIVPAGRRMRAACSLQTLSFAAS